MEATKNRRRPAYPDRRHIPPYPGGNEHRKTINDTMTKSFNGVLYDVMVKTSLEQVYDLDTDTTLVELLADIADGISGAEEDAERAYNMVSEILKDAPESMNTFKEVFDYVRLSGDPKSALMEVLDTKVDKEEGKGLSTHDLTDILYEKLVNDYTREEIDERFQILVDDVNQQFEIVHRNLEDLTVRIVKLEKEPNILLTDKEEVPPGLNIGDVYATLVEPDAGVTGGVII